VSGRPFSFAPGPTELHPAVRDELVRVAHEGYLSESHRSGAVRAQVKRLDEALRALLGIPAGHRVLLVGSATEAMERIAAGMGGGRSYHLVNGAFGRRFREVARASGLEVEDAEVPDGEGFRSRAVTLPGAVDLLALTQNETSTGARLPPTEVQALAGRARADGALVAVDLVSGWPTEPVDPGAIDAGFLSVQKGFGLPPGLGVIVASPALVERARARASANAWRGGWMHLGALAEAADRHETVATPNTLALRLLARVAEAYLDEGGQSALRARAEAGFERWWSEVARLDAGAPAGLRLRPFVADPELRSRTVAVVEVAGPGARPADPLRAALARRGLVVGDGYGPWKGRHLRVAHFPVQTPAMQARLLEALDEAVHEAGPEAGQG
jgi:phosphoserine aminotransferase